MNSFTHKGYGRIYVENEADINIVASVIKMMDDYEFGYMPKNLITTFDKYPDVVYVHKFDDIDLDVLTALCWKKGIKVWCLDNGSREYVTTDLTKYQHILDRSLDKDSKKWVYDAGEIFEALKSIQASYIGVTFDWREHQELNKKASDFLNTVNITFDVVEDYDSQFTAMHLVVYFKLHDVEYKYCDLELQVID